MNALARPTEGHMMHAEFAGPIVMLGFGSIGRGVLPLLERHIGFDRSKFVVIAPDDSDRGLLDERKLKFEKLAITRENYRDRSEERRVGKERSDRGRHVRDTKT